MSGGRVNVLPGRRRSRLLGGIGCRSLIQALAAIAILAACAGAPAATQAETHDDSARYAEGNALILPADYREWMFLSSGLGMVYEGEERPASDSPRPPRFQNVFVNRSAYNAFRETGEWPNGSVFVLEIRASASDDSINRSGRFQSNIVFLEAEVKDSRFEGGWAFYNYGRPESLPATAKPLVGDRVEPCFTCHTEHAAVEMTFVQFYPTLLESAREKGTLKPGFE